MKQLASLLLLSAFACSGDTLYTWTIGDFSYSFSSQSLGDVSSNSTLSVTSGPSAESDGPLNGAWPSDTCSANPEYGCITGIELASAPNLVPDRFSGQGQAAIEVCYDFSYSMGLCNASAANIQALFPSLDLNAYGTYYGSLIGFPDVQTSFTLQDPPSGVPEPGDLAIAGLGLAGVKAWISRRRKPVASV